MPSVLLDLPAAFDTADHEILLPRLEYDVGIFGVAYRDFALISVIVCRLSLLLVVPPAHML